MGNIGLLATFGLAMATIWIGINRFTMRLENNWPLLYYLGLVVYLNKYDMVLNPYVVYVAVVCGLFVRFEFMKRARRLLHPHYRSGVAGAHLHAADPVRC